MNVLRKPLQVRESLELLSTQPSAYYVALALVAVGGAANAWLAFARFPAEALPLLPDATRGVSADAFAAFLSALGEHGRHFYLFWLAVEFLLFVPGVALLLALPSVRALPAGSTNIADPAKVDYVARFAPLLPFVASLADMLENVSAAVLVLLYPETADEYAAFHATCAQIKWLSLVLWLALMLGIALRQILRPAASAIAKSKKN